MKGAKKPYHYVSATAVGNRAFLLAVNANGRQVTSSDITAMDLLVLAANALPRLAEWATLMPVCCS